METWVRIRNRIIRWKYCWLLKPVLFQLDPERVHDWFVWIGKTLGSMLATRWLTKTCFYYENPILEQEIFGLKFKNPIGLAAGFDKNAEMVNIMSAVGFGFTEVGSITGRSCAGNPKPRLWRLPKSRSLIVYYGLKNNGAEEVVRRLFDIQSRGAQRLDIEQRVRYNFPLGISIAKTNDQETVTTEAGIADYLIAYKTFVEAGVGDYFTVNISCPNTFGGEPFIDPTKLDQLLSALSLLRGPSSYFPKPMFLKLPPDLSYEQIDQIIAVAEKNRISGFICTNLTKDRTLPEFKNKIKETLPTDKGGLSGKIVEDLANKQIEYVYSKIKNQIDDKKMIIIGCGGIFTAEDAYTKIKAGASLLQLITGMIYEGPQVISEINQGLVELLKKDSYQNISEAVGAGS